MDEPRRTDETPRPDERGNADESLDQPLADVPPSPLPNPLGQSFSEAILNVGVILAAGAGAFILFAGTMTPTMGATRSTKLKWAERQRQIEQAARNAKPDHTEQR
jgi:hypothetical protein